MDYLETASRCVENVKSDEKLNKQLDELQEFIKDYGLKDYQMDIDFARRQKDFEGKKYYLNRALEGLDDLIGALCDLNDSFDCITDAEDEKAEQAAKEAEEARVHGLGGITFSELSDRFWNLNNKNLPRESAIIYFKPTEYTKDWSKDRLAFRIDSDNKMFQPGKCGYSLFGSSLADPDNYVRLDEPMRDPDDRYRWKVDYCRLEA